MKRTFWVIGLALALSLIGTGFFAHPVLAQRGAAPRIQQPAPAPEKKSEPAKVEVTPERFWKMRIEKLEVEKQKLQNEAAAYEKKAASGKAGQEAKESQDKLKADLKELRAKYDAAIKGIENKFSDVMEETKKTSGAERAVLTKKRNEFLSKHPELDAKVKALNNDIAGLTKKVADLKANDKTAAKPAPAKTKPKPKP